MDKLRMQSVNKVDENILKIGKMFPNCVTEVMRDGNVELGINFDKLKQELSSVIIEGGEECYDFTWPDKRKSILQANSPINKTLRPVINDETIPTGSDSNGKPYMSTGSVGKDGTVGKFDSENLYIEGDNLDVLKLLQNNYLGKVKMIYIDPPYNTGSDFVYEDDFSMSKEKYADIAGGGSDEDGNRMVQNLESNGRFHTDWLNMIYPRLKVAKDLLTDDGVIFISIDDHEVENLKKVCNEVFGASNFVSQFIWQSTAGSNTGRTIVTLTEYILCYGKSASLIPFKLGMKKGNWKHVDKYLEKRGKYELQKLDGMFTSNHFSPSLVYPITLPNGEDIYPGGNKTISDTLWNWRWSKTKVEWGLKNGFIESINRDGKWTVYFKNYEKVDNTDHERKGSVPQKNMINSEIATTSSGTMEINSLFGRQVFEFPKASNLVKYLANTIMLSKNDIFLDFFSGSATTAHAVMQLNAEDGGNRKFICVQLPEVTDEKSEACKAGYKNICEIGKERIRRAGKKIIEESAHIANAYEFGLLEEGKDYAEFTNSSKAVEAREKVKQCMDTGFRVLKLDSSNMKDIYYHPSETMQTMLDDLESNIKEDRLPQDLLFQVMLDMGVKLDGKIEQCENNGYTYYVVGDYGNDVQPNLIACFDNNLDESVVTAIAKLKPLYAVFRDSSFANDSVAVNFEQIFNTYSPNTIRKVI